MHGMLSLAVLVAAFAGLAGWAVFLSLRLYRACSAARARQARPAGRTHATDGFGSAGDTDVREPGASGQGRHSSSG